MLVRSDPFFNSRSGRFIAAAARYLLPAIYPQREYASGGGLVSYGPDFSDGYRNGGVYVGKILRGASPADLPVMQPTKFQLVINLKTAKVLDVTVPSTLLVIADEVLEQIYAAALVASWHECEVPQCALDPTLGDHRK